MREMRLKCPICGQRSSAREVSTVHNNAHQLTSTAGFVASSISVSVQASSWLQHKGALQTAQIKCSLLISVAIHT